MFSNVHNKGLQRKGAKKEDSRQPPGPNVDLGATNPSCHLVIGKG